MFIDIVVPDGNEEKFVEMAERLGYNAICFLYKDNPKRFPQENPHVKTFTASTTKSNADLLLAKSSAALRQLVEDENVDGIYSFESERLRDFTHHRASGLNHTLCGLMRENHKMEVFNFNDILTSKHRHLLVGRITQNIGMCRKFKVETAIASFARSPHQMRSPHDLIALFSTLGMHPEEAKNSMKSLLKRIKLNERKKLHGFVSDGIEVLD